MKLRLSLLLLVLAAFYAFVLSLVLRPRVSEAYAAYYIDQTSPLSVAETQRIRPLVAGRLYEVDDPAVVFNDWTSPAHGLRAPAWPAPKVFVELPGQGGTVAGRLDMVVHPCVTGCAPLLVYANDTLVFAGHLPQSPSWHFQVPGDVLRPGRNVVVFKVCGPDGDGGCDFARTIHIESIAFVAQ